ncbi:hypothetical protein KYG_06594 [Acidovorax sp. NO-1]|nr:hypothetical protein KYG_06594 [Acidovorax sp. NO-1]
MAHWPVKLAAMKWPGKLQNIYSVHLLASAIARCLKVSLHSWPF